MSAHTFSAEPKPYALVAIPSEAPRRMGPATHERFVGLTGHLLLEFTVVSEYLFVGSGDYGVDPSARGDRPDVWYTFSRRDGRVCVPGTSLKGAVRGLLEAISNSCVSQYRRGREEVGPSHRPCQDQQRLCPACRLFGRTGLRGRVAFGDGLPLGQPHLQIVKIAELWEPKRFTNARGESFPAAGGPAAAAQFPVYRGRSKGHTVPDHALLRERHRARNGIDLPRAGLAAQSKWLP